MGDAFAVADDLVGERSADLRESSGEGCVVGADDGLGGTGGEKENGVVGGGVAVDGDAVEADFDGAVEVVLKQGGLDGGVGEDVDEHGGVRHELGMDHAGALAEGGDTDFMLAVGTVDFEASEGGLFNGVGGEDGGGDIEEVIDAGAERCGGFGEGSYELVGGKRDADDAGG